MFYVQALLVMSHRNSLVTQIASARAYLKRPLTRDLADICSDKILSALVIAALLQ